MQCQVCLPRIHAGRVALVTGSSDARGIGIEVARELAKHGCSIILSGTREPQNVAPLMEAMIRDFDVAVHYIQADLSVPSLIDKLHEDIKQIYPNGVDILVNNAGIFVQGNPVEQVSLEVWDNVIQIMLTAPFHLTKLILPDMKRKGWGRIINTSSDYGTVGRPMYSTYVSARHGLNGLTKTVALETTDTGVTCNAVAMGITDTALTDVFLKESLSPDHTEKDLEEFKKSTLSSRFIRKDKIAELMAFLCSPSADQISGTIIPVDAGTQSR